MPTEVVRVALPPPNRPIAPCFHEIPAGARLVRIFDPTRRNQTALTFRSYGPLKRFDHHRGREPDRAASWEGVADIHLFLSATSVASP